MYTNPKKLLFPLASKASWEVANFIKKKHAPTRILCLSVCLSQTLTPISWCAGRMSDTLLVNVSSDGSGSIGIYVAQAGSRKLIFRQPNNKKIKNFGLRARKKNYHFAS